MRIDRGMVIPWVLEVGTQPQVHQFCHSYLTASLATLASYVSPNKMLRDIPFRFPGVIFGQISKLPHSVHFPPLGISTYIDNSVHHVLFLTESWVLHLGGPANPFMPWGRADISGSVFRFPGAISRYGRGQF